jgi:hypothetical protein
MTDIDIVHAIIAVVSAEAGCKEPIGVLRRNSEHRISKFRDDAIWLARTRTQLSYPELGAWFHRHHTSALASFRRAELRRERNPPRKDGRTWKAWHAYLWQKVEALCANSAPVA